jgi:DNA invertase Pin-like site-specific DNA recombinase
VTHDRATGTLAVVERLDGLQEALTAIAERRASGLVVRRLAVLGTRDLLQDVVFALILRYGGALFTCEEGMLDWDSPADANRRDARQALRALTLLDHCVRAMRARIRRRRKVARGGYAGGAPRFGLRAEAHELVVEPTEQAALDRIAELRQAGVSFRAIAASLHEEGFQPKRSDRWHPETIRRIVQRLSAHAESPGGSQGPP